MTNMRNLLNLMESVDDDLPLSGTLDAKKLAEMLPELTDVPRFVMAMQKIRRGDAERLTLQEKGQLALAFLSLLKGDRTETMKVMRKLMMVQAKGLNEGDDAEREDWETGGALHVSEWKGEWMWEIENRKGAVEASQHGYATREEALAAGEKANKTFRARHYEP